MERLNCESGIVVVTVTCISPVCSMEDTLVYALFQYEPAAGSRWRLRDATTSAAVRGVPSWKVTPGLMEYTQVVGVGLSHFSARPGETLRSAFQRNRDSHTLLST